MNLKLEKTLSYGRYDSATRTQTVNILHLIFRCFVKRKKKVYKRKRKMEKGKDIIMSWFSHEENFGLQK